MSFTYLRNRRATAQPPQKTGFQPRSSIKINLPVQERKGVDIDEFIGNMNLELYAELTEEQQEECLADLDAIELFEKLKGLDDELAHVKLDLHLFTAYLQQYNPKLLIGLKQRRSIPQSPRKSATGRTSTTVPGSSRRTMAATDTTSIGTETGRAHHGINVNFRTKADLAERAVVEADKRIKQLQKKARKEMRGMRAELEELRCRAEETDETCKNFVLNFMADEGDIVFLETANEEKIIDKLKQFTNNWFKRARGLMATMRLRMSHLDEKTRQYRHDIIVKADLSTVLNSVDFDMLMIERDKLQKEMEEIYKNMYGVKDKTGRALMVMGEESASMVMMQQKHKRMESKMAVIAKSIVKLEKDCQNYEEICKKDMEKLEELEAKVERYKAPSVADYVKVKDELFSLEKEENILKRKINILKMTLSNLNN